MTNPFVAVAIGAALPYGAAVLGATRALGAHPFWALSLVAIGAPIGAALALLLWWVGIRKAMAAGGSLALMLLAYGAATWGKAAFAASYAENGFAGQIWYFGWIAAAAGATATIVSLLLRPRPV